MRSFKVNRCEQLGIFETEKCWQSESQWLGKANLSKVLHLPGGHCFTAVLL